jgi:hypothetical protein
LYFPASKSIRHEFYYLEINFLTPRTIPDSIKKKLPPSKGRDGSGSSHPPGGHG